MWLMRKIRRIPDKKRLLIQCADSVIEITELIPQGKNKMDGQSFINGFRPESGELFGEVAKKFTEGL